MSNTLLFDPLLVGYLARELDQRLRGRACAAAPLLASDRSAVLRFDRGEALRFDLHPTRGWVRLLPRETPGAELDALCLGVEAPPDERWLQVRLRVGDRFRVEERRLVVELHSNQWNALLVAEDERIVSVLRARSTGERELRPGHPYAPPPPPRRYGADSADEAEARRRWAREVEAAALGERRTALLASFAYTGAPNAGWILAEPETAFRRWWWLRSLPPPRPTLIRDGGRITPYPVPLEGLPGEPIGSLLEGMERIADEVPARPADGGLPLEEREQWVLRRLEGAQRRVRRLAAQLEEAGEAERLRTHGDLLLANLHRVGRGADQVRLDDWEGEAQTISLDPALSAAENAARIYDEARRRGRAEAQLPELLREANAETERWEEAARVLAGGVVPEWVVAEMERSLAPASGGKEARREGEARPYRTYFTSGRLEVRVGRSARDNDRLTFGHARPHDVWLHARSVAGSHVILRWADAENPPPARDLEEAATLAALFSRARTSALVPVDWTRRRHVRKPRGAPPGAVIPQRVKTLFVEPDAAIEERMKG